MRWRAFADLPEAKVRAGQILETVQCRTLSRTFAAPLWMWCIPEEMGLSWQEKDWPEILPTEPTLGRAFEPVLVDLDKLAASQVRLSELSAERTRILAGLSEVEAKLTDLEQRTAIVGLSVEDYTAARLYLHHRQQWRTKLTAIESELAGVARVVEHGLADRAFAERHAPQVEAGSLKTAVDLAQQPEGHGEGLESLEALRLALLRAAAIVCQFDGLATFLPDEQSAVPRYCYQPPAHDSLLALRAGLKTWAERTERGSLSLRGLLAEPDVRALLARAEELVEAAREKAVVEEGAELVPA